MGRNLDPKCKQCRRIGEKLFLKGERCFSPKCAMIKRNYPPGMHGAKRGPRVSEYGIQLQEKQKAARTYQLLEKQFHGYYERARKIKQGQTGDNLLALLELRLDNVLYRSGVAASRSIARQIVNHGHLLVNGKNMDIPSYTVASGDIITFKEQSKSNKIIQEMLKKLDAKRAPGWLEVQDVNNFQIKVLATPTVDELPEGIDTALIVEYYSR